MGRAGERGGGEVSSAWVFCVSRCADVEFRRPTIAVWTTHVGDRRLARAGLGRPGWVRDGRPEQRKARLQQAPWYGRAAAAAPLRIGISFGRMAAEARGKAVCSLPPIGWFHCTDWLLGAPLAESELTAAMSIENATAAARGNLRHGIQKSAVGVGGCGGSCSSCLPLRPPSVERQTRRSQVRRSRSKTSPPIKQQAEPLHHF